MTLWESIILGIIQGLTEFLPVSSSGHLALGQKLFGLEEGNLFVTVMLHGATFAATVIVLRHRIFSICKAAFMYLRSPSTQQWNSDPDRIMLTSILLTTLVTGVLGLLFDDVISQAFTSIKLVGTLLLITGVILWLPVLFGKADNPKNTHLSKPTALGIGLAQAMAMLPGISRSGTTLAASMLGGLSRKRAGEYAFLISLPVIAGALLLEALKLTPNAGISLPILGAGILSAFFTGLVALKLLLRWIAEGKLHYFSWYCWTVGIIAIVLA